MASFQLPFKQCKLSLKCYRKMENVVKVQRHWGNQFRTPVTITRLCDEFESDRTVQNVNSG
jgi:hypothetical protein